MNTDAESNFIQLMKLRGNDQQASMTTNSSTYLQQYTLQDIVEWLDKKDEKYTSAEVQNDLLKHMSTTAMCKVADRIQKAAFFYYG